MNRFLPCIYLLALAACDQSDGGVKGAKGDTPVKYVLCGPTESSCFVYARFKDLDSCQRHKAWADMLCDKRSMPDEMLCRKDPGLSIGVAYCTY